MFRFVDVLPTLTSSTACSKTPSGVPEGCEDVCFRAYARSAYCCRIAPAIPAAVIKSNVTAMANIFITGTDGESAFPNLQQIWKAGCTIYCRYSGEAVVSDREADEYAGRYRALLDFLADATRQWKPKEPLAPMNLPWSTCQ